MKKRKQGQPRQPLPKKVKQKENDVNDVDYVSSINELTNESQPTVACSNPYKWPATPLASLHHSYCMNEEKHVLLIIFAFS